MINKPGYCVFKTLLDFVILHKYVYQVHWSMIDKIALCLSHVPVKAMISKLIKLLYSI